MTDDSFGPPRNPVKPFANVYSCSPEMVAKVIHPDSDWTAKLGTNPETDREVLIDLNTLVRQGLILTGAGRKETKVQVVNWERLATTVFENVHEQTKEIMAPLTGGRGTKVFKLLSASVDECKENEEFPTKKAITARAQNKVGSMWPKAKEDEEHNYC